LLGTFHDQVFENQTVLTEENLRQWAKDLGLNSNQFNRCVDLATYKDKVQADQALGNANESQEWDGAAWSSQNIPTTQTIYDVEAISTIDAWAVGRNGTIIHFDQDALYETSGLVISSAFNMSDASPVQAVEWDETAPFGTDITIDVSTAPNSGGSPGTWTSWVNAATSKGTLLPTSLNGNQWVRYRVNLTGDGNDTPVLTEVRVNYK